MKEGNAMAYEKIKDLLKSEKPWEYSFEKECKASGYDGKDALERYFIYKSIGSILKNVNLNYFELLKFDTFDRERKKHLIEEAHKSMCKSCPKYAAAADYGKENYFVYGNIADCDGSGGDFDLALELYDMLWDWKKNEDDTFGKIELFRCSCPENNCIKGQFGGDTMNSVQTVLGELVKHLAKEQGKEGEYNKTLKNPRAWYSSVLYCITLYRTFNTADKLPNFTSDLKNIPGLESYMELYHTLGNFVLVPAKFNGKRALPTADFWDSSLVWLKEEGFGSEKTFFSKDEFTKYINYFFLWDYIEAKEEGYKVNHLFSAHKYIEYGRSKDSLAWTNLSLTYKGLKNMNAYIKDNEAYEEYKKDVKDIEKNAKEFFETAAHHIRHRGIFITILLLLKSEAENNDQISAFFDDPGEGIRSECFLNKVHQNGYQEVLNKIETLLPKLDESLETVKKIKDGITAFKDMDKQKD